MSPTGSPVHKWTGKALALFPSVPLFPSPTISPRVSPIAAGPLTVGGSRWLWELLPSPSSPSGAPVRSHLHLSSPFTPPTRYRPTWSLGAPPIPLGVHGPPLVPGRCPSCEKTQIPCPPARHLDSAPTSMLCVCCPLPWKAFLLLSHLDIPTHLSGYQLHNLP